MTKGPLVWAAIILAALLMMVSAIMMLNRDLFLANTTLFACISGGLAIAVLAVLLFMLYRSRQARP
jgi:hypothetical protein